MNKASVRLLILSLALPALAMAKAPVKKGKLKTLSSFRQVSASSCDLIPIKLAPGMTTQLIFDEAPVQTLHADPEHFNINSSPDAPRSIAIIPRMSGYILQQAPQTPAAFTQYLNQNIATNFFVLFKNSNQLVFQLKFVERSDADTIVRIHQTFGKDCQL